MTAIWAFLVLLAGLYLAAELLTWASRKLSWVGWWFYRRAMAAAARREQELELARYWLTRPVPVAACPPHHQLLPIEQHDRLHDALDRWHAQHQPSLTGNRSGIIGD